MRFMKKLIILIALIVFSGLVAQAQTVSLTGTVKDADTEEPVIGASILVKNTTTGTITDLDGHFSLTVPQGATVVVSSIGYNDYEFVAEDRLGNINIALKQSTEFLEDVIVVGYGSVKKENLTGAVDQVSAEVFEGRPAGNATQMLVGSVPNLNITLADGKPGRSASYNVRGTTSIGGGGSALVLIDGVEGDPSLLNPNDIESVSVLTSLWATA